MLKRTKKSLIIFMSSYADSIPMPYNSGYAASKAFIWSLSRSIKDEVTPKIDITALRPLYVKTRLASFMPEGHITMISPEKFVESSIRDIEKGKSASYGHWRHKALIAAIDATEWGQKRMYKYLKKCNMEADRQVKEHLLSLKKKT